MLRDKAPRARGECLIKNAMASTVAAARLAQETSRQIEESRRLLVQYQVPRSIADLFAQPGSAPSSLEHPGR
jgi:hypothetical protein